jgi:hypothetical protein
MGHGVLFQLLLLLVQQLQGMPPHQRTSFLHSPAGSEVLRVLSKMSSDEAAMRKPIRAMFDKAALGAAGVQELQEQGRKWWRPQAYEARAVLEMAVLPGLLLQPVPELWPPWVVYAQLTGTPSSSAYRSSSSGGADVSHDGECSSSGGGGGGGGHGDGSTGSGSSRDLHATAHNSSADISVVGSAALLVSVGKGGCMSAQLLLLWGLSQRSLWHTTRRCYAHATPLILLHVDTTT